MSRSKNAEADTLLSRRKMLKLTAAGAAGLTLLKRGSDARALPMNDFLDLTAVERIADRDAGVHPPLLIDVQTHVWSGGLYRFSKGPAIRLSAAPADGFKGIVLQVRSLRKAKEFLAQRNLLRNRRMTWPSMRRSATTRCT